MSLLAILAATGTRPPAPDPDGPDGPPVVPDSLLFSTAPTVLDRDQDQLLVHHTQIPGITALREQDDIVYDPGHPDPGKRWCFYFSAMLGATSLVYVCHSADGIEWTNPVYCFSGQDPSITQTWEPNPVAYRDDQGRLVMFYENNSTSDVDAAVSTDGITWTRVKAGAIARAAGTSGWDHVLVGSPNARHDGTGYIVGYEGIQHQPFGAETYSIAWGATPSTLVKSPGTPIIDPNTVTGLGKSIVVDAIYLNPAGDRVFATAHGGMAETGITMWRMITTKTDPRTWQAGDFTMIGGMVDTNGRPDLTTDLYRGRYVTSQGHNEAGAPTGIAMVTTPSNLAP